MGKIPVVKMTTEEEREWREHNKRMVALYYERNPQVLRGAPAPATPPKAKDDAPTFTPGVLDYDNMPNGREPLDRSRAASPGLDYSIMPT